jgi:hypothetical protein
MSYNEKSKLDTWSKQTQTKPILPAMAGKIAPLLRMSFILMGLVPPVLRSFSEGGSDKSRVTSDYFAGRSRVLLHLGH